METLRHAIPPDWKVDVLINECTFSDDREEQAKAKKHCTQADALHVSRLLEARFTALTHFSQRYPKSLSHDQGLKKELGETKVDTSNKGVQFFCAHDLMKVELRLLEPLCALRNELEDCFVSDDEE